VRAAKNNNPFGVVVISSCGRRFESFRGRRFVLLVVKEETHRHPHPFDDAAKDIYAKRARSLVSAERGFCGRVACYVLSFVWKSWCLRGKNSFERDHLNCSPRGVRSYALVSLRVLLKISLRECFFLTLMRLYSYGYTRDTIFGRNFSTAVSTLLKESESVAHTRRTNTPTKEQHERPHVINGIVLRERERERITLSERACDDDDDAKCIRVRSSMRFDDLFVGEAEGNNIDENENESY